MVEFIGDVTSEDNIMQLPACVMIDSHVVATARASESGSDE
jgi:hypothetical protein